MSVVDAPAALNLLMDLNRQTPFPGIFSYRFVAKTNATLGFTRFGDQTAVLEVDGPLNDTAKRYRSVQLGMKLE